MERRRISSRMTRRRDSQYDFDLTESCDTLGSNGNKSRHRAIIIGTSLFEDFMAALIDAIDVKRKNFFEFENTPYLCLEALVNTPTARGGQTLVRLKMRNLLTNAVFEKSFKGA